MAVSGQLLQNMSAVCVDAVAVLRDSACRQRQQQSRAWAERHGYADAPAAPEAVAGHLAEISRTAGTSTLKVRRAAIGAAHRAAGLPDPTASELVKQTLSGLSRKAARPARQAAPLTASALAAIRKTARLRRSGGTVRRRTETAAAARRRGLADIALCGTMRDALLRREEAAALTWADIAWEDDGSGRLTIRRSKTDPEARGAVQYFGPPTMQDLAAIKPPDARPGDSVFGISGSQVNRRIAAAARAADQGDGFTGHSPRVGMAQDLAAAGTTLPELMQAGRWSSRAMPALYVHAQSAGRGAVAKYYADSAERGQKSPDTASAPRVADPKVR